MIKVRRNGKVIRFIQTTTLETSKPVSNIRFQSSNIKSIRRSKSNPARKHLTKREWEQRGEWLRYLNLIGYWNACSLSYDDMKSAYESTKRCAIMRIARYDAC